MECLNCNNNIQFCYHILRHGIKPTTIVGFGEFCSIPCVIEKLKVSNHGDSDFFDCLSLIKQKYYNNNIQTYYTPDEVREIRPLLEPVEQVEVKKERYQVKRASKNKRSTNDILKSLFTGHNETIMTAKNLCSSK
jgi:hypothetical protein